MCATWTHGQSKAFKCTGSHAASTPGWLNSGCHGYVNEHCNDLRVCGLGSVMMESVPSLKVHLLAASLTGKVARPSIYSNEL